MVTLFVLEVPDYRSAMLIYFIYLYANLTLAPPNINSIFVSYSKFGRVNAIPEGQTFSRLTQRKKYFFCFFPRQTCSILHPSPFSLTNMQALARITVVKRRTGKKIFGVPNIDIISQDSLMYINPINPSFSYISYIMYINIWD